MALIKSKEVVLVAMLIVAETWAKNCIQHYCGCPPFLPRDPNLSRSLYFTKYPYSEHYAILGRSKELHCCIGGNLTSVLWSKDGVQYPFRQWGSSQPVLYARNQSLVLLDVTSQDEGSYKCVATDGSTGQSVDHVTQLRSFALPAFRHPPIWKHEPGDTNVQEGQPVDLKCAATVGPQYDTYRLQPVRAVWQNQQGQPITGTDVQTLQEVSDDGMVVGLRLYFPAVGQTRAGSYTCTIANNYGTLRKTVTLSVGEEDASGKLAENATRKALERLLKSQLDLYVNLVKISRDHPLIVEKVLKSLNIH